MTNLSEHIALIKTAVGDRYEKLLDKHSKVENFVSDSVENWYTFTKRYIDTENPFYQLRHRATSNAIGSPNLNDFNWLLKEFKSECVKHNKAPDKFWDNEKAKLDKLLGNGKGDEAARTELATTYQLLTIEYQKLADTLFNNWELNKIHEMRVAFIKALLERLAAIEDLLEYAETLGLEHGLLFDLSAGAENQLQVDEVIRWLEYLKEDKGVQSLLELMGRISQIKQSEKVEKVLHSHIETISVPDFNSREEIVGLKLGKDIEHALPGELALLSDPETGILFDLKYIESSLLCFELEGTTEINKEVQVESETSILEDEKQGPLIICVDTSGSMQGAPETIAKAVTLIMATKARQSQRSCYLINFSTRIKTINLSTDFSMSDLLAFLKMSFHGGTDVAPAIRHGLEMMDSDEYTNADMLVISDFIMAHLPNNLVKQMELYREQGNKFNSLVIDDVFMDNRMRSLFDFEWVYNPATSSISEIIEFERNISW